MGDAIAIKMRAIKLPKMAWAVAILLYAIAIDWDNSSKIPIFKMEHD